MRILINVIIRSPQMAIQGDDDGFAALLPPHWRDTVQDWIKDDVPSIDIGGLVVGSKPEEAVLNMKTCGVIAGVPFFDAVFESLGCTVEWIAREGEEVQSLPPNGKLEVARVKGPARLILLGERTALNTLSRASGVATLANRARRVCDDCGWRGFIAGTRKTTPGFRIVEKYALLVGGAATHRLDLSNMVMLKDNHIWSAGSITEAVKLARKAAGFSSKIEVECQSHQEATEAADAGADIVMLDNMDPDTLKTCARQLKEDFPTLLIEASGGITIDTMQAYMSPHVDIISQGALTQGYSCLDFSLKICREKPQS